jgi:hypothetical protein
VQEENKLRSKKKKRRLPIIYNMMETRVEYFDYSKKRRLFFQSLWIILLLFFLIKNFKTWQNGLTTSGGLFRPKPVFRYEYKLYQGIKHYSKQEYPHWIWFLCNADMSFSENQSLKEMHKSKQMSISCTGLYLRIYLSPHLLSAGCRLIHSAIY